MANFRKEISDLADYFKKAQPVERILFRWLYLTPEARVQRLQELMMPTSNKKQ